jgi:hypothetical protein
MDVVLQGKKLCSNDERTQRTDNERRRINARNRDQTQLGTFVIMPCPEGRRRARGL